MARLKSNRLPRIRHRRGETAIHRDRLAVDVGCLDAGKKQSHRGEFMRLAGALQRIELADLVLCAAPVCTENLSSGVVVVKSAKDGV